MTINLKLPRLDISNNGDPDIQLSCVSNMFVRMMHFRHQGDIEQGHSHPFDHMTLLADGALAVEVDGISRDFYAPKIIFITKDKEHKLTALEDHTVAFCVHAIRDGERVEDIIDPDSLVIPPGAEGVDHLIQNHPKLFNSIVGSKIE